MEAKDGERHIYANLESCTNSVDSRCKTSQDRHKTADTHPQVLINTQMKHPACLHKKRCINKQGKCKKASPQAHGNPSPANTVMVDTNNLYSEPEIHSTLHVAKELAQARKMQPKVSQLMKNKLDSPNTSAKLKKQVKYLQISHTNTAILPLSWKGCLTVP